MKFFDENYSQEIPTRIKCLRKKYNLKQTDLDYKEIIFQDITKFVENLFYHCFSSIIFRDLETVDRSEVSIQYESIHKKNADFKRFFQFQYISVQSLFIIL